MRGLRVDDQRVPAKLGNADRERDPGAQRRLVKQHRHRARAGERLPGEPVCPELGRNRNYLALFGRRQVVVADEVPDSPPNRAGRRAYHDTSWPPTPTPPPSIIPATPPST